VKNENGEGEVEEDGEPVKVVNLITWQVQLDALEDGFMCKLLNMVELGHPVNLTRPEVPGANYYYPEGHSMAAAEPAPTEPIPGPSSRGRGRIHDPASHIHTRTASTANGEAPLTSPPNTRKAAEKRKLSDTVSPPNEPAPPVSIPPDPPLMSSEAVVTAVSSVCETIESSGGSPKKKDDEKKTRLDETSIASADDDEKHEQQRLGDGQLDILEGIQHLKG